MKNLYLFLLILNLIPLAVRAQKHITREISVYKENYEVDSVLNIFLRPKENVKGLYFIICYVDFKIPEYGIYQIFKKNAKIEVGSFEHNLSENMGIFKLNGCTFFVLDAPTGAIFTKTQIKKKFTFIENKNIYNLNEFFGERYFYYNGRFEHAKTFVPGF